MRATSARSASLSAATAGRPQIALGNALGSNVTVLALVVGLTALVGSIRAPRAAVRSDVGAALAEYIAVTYANNARYFLLPTTVNTTVAEILLY